MGGGRGSFYISIINMNQSHSPSFYILVVQQQNMYPMRNNYLVDDDDVYMHGDAEEILQARAQMQQEIDRENFEEELERQAREERGEVVDQEQLDDEDDAQVADDQQQEVEADVEAEPEVVEAEVEAEVEEVEEVDAEGPPLSVYEAFSSTGVEDTEHEHLSPTLSPSVVGRLYDYRYFTNTCTVCSREVPSVLWSMREHAQTEHPEELLEELKQEINRRRNEPRSLEDEEVFEEVGMLE